MLNAPEPLGDDELGRLAARHLDGYGLIVLAVSGGADSTMLLELARCWRHSPAGAAAAIHVATVDHSLRPEAADEAAAVGLWSERLGFPHHVLVWKGDVGSSALQEQAREARYGLLGALARRLCGQKGGDVRCAVVTAHHADDQAETFLMRLARGSGLDGLAAITAVRGLPAGSPDGSAGTDRDMAVDLVRPFLEIPKARLKATLVHRGRTWFEDPGNHNPRFERVRIRRALDSLAATGVGASTISRSAARLDRARAAIDHYVVELLRHSVDLNHGACATMATEDFDAAPAEVRIRLLRRLVAAFGGRTAQLRLSQIEEIEARLHGRDRNAATLGGAYVERDGSRLHVRREPGRHALPSAPLAAGSLVWDGRYLIRLSPGCDDAGLSIGPLSAAVARQLTSVRPLRDRRGLVVPLEALVTMPAVWQGDRCVGTFHPAMAPVGDMPCTALFLNDF